MYSIRAAILRVNVDNADVDGEARIGALESFFAHRLSRAIPVVNVPLRGLCAGQKGSGVTGEETGEAGVATRRAPLGPRLTCALHRVVFMRGQ